MKKHYLSLVIALAIGSFFVSYLNSVNASLPSDYGLKEGDLISAIFSDDPDVYKHFISFWNEPKTVPR